MSLSATLAQPSSSPKSSPFPRESHESDDSCPPNKRSRKTRTFADHIEVGSGDFGRAYRVRCCTDDCTYIQKTVSKSSSNEAHVLKSLDHPGIVRYYRTWKENAVQHILLEDCGESVSHLYLKADVSLMPPSKVMVMLKQILQALSYLHSKGYVHLDVKPENICYNAQNDSYKLIDFGQCSRLSEKVLQDPGDGAYMAPEVLASLGDRQLGYFSYSLDIYSLGVSAWRLLTRNEPVRDIRFREYSFPSDIPEDLVRIVFHMIQDHKTRPNANELLEHYFDVTNMPEPLPPPPTPTQPSRASFVSFESPVSPAPLQERAVPDLRLSPCRFV
eukprot:c5066_g1_i1.p1 GENE.c5066_g1_i1~~c5066_g1_i1.p1  ORF type:complete len:330 (+),score=11.88 c5066_g1_i1:43-1032(+)